ncbi:MAG: hypothetical protein GX825_00765 [Syntrophomonadaceae bacterium]|nr:hypothetical protein [Syntrophomonadaceae bacterium]
MSIIRSPINPACDFQGIGLKEAIRRAYPTAMEWRKNARLAYAVSTEAGKKDSGGNKAIDGRQADWNIVFIDEKSGQNLWVAVREGQPEFSREVFMGHTNPIKSSDLKYDSMSAVAILESQRHLDRPSKIHFELVNYQSPLLKVYQTNQAAVTTIAWIDPKKGHLILNSNSAID